MKAPKAKRLPASISPAKTSAEQKAGILANMRILGALKAGENAGQFHSSILELRSFDISDEEIDYLLAIVHAQADSMPKDGTRLRVNVEVAANFLSLLIANAYSFAEAKKKKDPEALAAAYVDLAVRRAYELWAQGIG